MPMDDYVSNQVWKHIEVHEFTCVLAVYLYMHTYTYGYPSLYEGTETESKASFEFELAGLGPRTPIDPLHPT
jgi:hypothetical protein